MKAAAFTPEAQKFWNCKQHLVSDRDCTCGMYAGISLQHMINIGYIGRGIHGEVVLWGRLYRHTLGWHAQYAHLKFFVVPANMIPFGFDEAEERLKAIVEFDVDIYLQPEREACIEQERIPLWIREYGYSQQGISFLIEKRQNWYSGNKAIHTLAVGDRIAVFSVANGGGIGLVPDIDGDEMYYTLFNSNLLYHKKVKEVIWNERNWRWEMTGTGFKRKLEQGTREAISQRRGTS